MRIRAAVLFCLFAGIASAQSTIRPGGGGGSSTITAGTTATSGCSPGGFFYSSSSLVACGANATNDGTTVTFGTGVTVGGSATTPFLSVAGTWNTSGAPTAVKVNVTNTASALGNLFDYQLDGASRFRLVGSNAAGHTFSYLTPYDNTKIGIMVFGNPASAVVGIEGNAGGLFTGTSAQAAVFGTSNGTAINFATNNIVRSTISSTGAITVGSSSLGTSVVPLTLTPGTGSTANIQNWTNSAGTVLSYVDNVGNPTSTAQFRAASSGGTGAVGGYSFSTQPTTGLYYNSGSGFVYLCSDEITKCITNSWAQLAFTLPSSYRMGFRSDTAVHSAADAFFMREAAATIELGADVNGAAVNQTFKAHDGITGTDISGANLTIAAGRGTGAGAGGSLIFQTAPVLGSGTTAQTLTTVVTLPKSGGIQIATGTKPACASGIRGTIYYVAGGAGVLDTLEVCRKDAADAYAWVSLF